MVRLWDVFDTEKTNAVPMMHLGTILRALDIDVPEDQLEELARQIDPPVTHTIKVQDKNGKEIEKEVTEPLGFIKYEKLEEILEEKLKDTETIEDFIEAMKALDTEKDGIIPAPIFK